MPVPLGQRLFGAYVNGSTVSSMESDVGRKLDIQSTFEDWSTPFSAYATATGGRAALIAWEPSGVSTQDVVDGRHDAYLRTWATAAKASGQQLFIRPWPEMNGDWAQWSAAYTGGDKSTVGAEQLKAAWRHVHDIFTTVGASNVKWVFSVNETDEPGRAGNRLEDYYPGDSYVDVLGFDAYNWAGYNGIPSRTHRQILDPIYSRLAAMSSTKPIWLTEGSASPNVSEADKAAWFTALLADPGYPRLAAYVLFSANKEQDWRYNSSSVVLNAFRQGLAVGQPTPTPPTPTVVIRPYGAIGALWSAKSGTLGSPLNYECDVPGVAGARMEDFIGGKIYWSSATGAHEVHGAILGKYLENSPVSFGLPISDETVTSDEVGRLSHFENGHSIYWTPSTGAHTIYGAIRAEWRGLGWELGILGYPITDESDALSPGRYNEFQRGAIYWSPTTGAHEVHGAIRTAWAGQSWEHGPLGFPITDEFSIPIGRQSTFQHGIITWNATTGVVTSLP